ncbi:MAG TPA: TetR/AcrR family transcriptional regulator [Steroidobacteraceae bacterium]|jgi:TetR/AcrR family transcriptional repressor of nem operon|nr:TetR/AcrR family transcriptional regulator [Steroidobacteraceae bacterium]
MMEDESTRERLIAAALRLFSEKGYQSTSVADVQRESDCHSGSFYHFFPTKQDLLLAVLERYRTGIVPMLIEPAWADVQDPIERVFALLARYRMLLETNRCAYGCPIGSLALELHEPDPAVRLLLAGNFTGWIDQIENCLIDARKVLGRGLDARRTASFVLTVMEGAVMQARTYRDLRPFDAAVTALRDYFNLLQSAAMREEPA